MTPSTGFRTDSTAGFRSCLNRVFRLFGVGKLMSGGATKKYSQGEEGLTGPANSIGGQNFRTIIPEGVMTHLIQH